MRQTARTGGMRNRLADPLEPVILAIKLTIEESSKKMRIIYPMISFMILANGQSCTKQTIKILDGYSIKWIGKWNGKPHWIPYLEKFRSCSIFHWFSWARLKRQLPVEGFFSTHNWLILTICLIWSIAQHKLTLHCRHPHQSQWLPPHQYPHARIKWCSIIASHCHRRHIRARLDNVP